MVQEGAVTHFAFPLQQRLEPHTPSSTAPSLTAGIESDFRQSLMSQMAEEHQQEGAVVAMMRQQRPHEQQKGRATHMLSEHFQMAVKPDQPYQAKPCPASYRQPSWPLRISSKQPSPAPQWDTEEQSSAVWEGTLHYLQQQELE